MPYRKRHSFSPEMAAEEHDLFDSLPDELVISILSKLSSSAGCPLDFITVLMTCKRLNSLALHPLALSKGSSKMFAIKAKNWSESAGRFLKLCADAGNAEACHALLLLVKEEQRRKFKEELEKLFEVLEFQPKEYEAFREEPGIPGITDIFKSCWEKEDQEFKEESKKLDEVLMVRLSVPYFLQSSNRAPILFGF